jgi:transposase
VLPAKSGRSATKARHAKAKQSAGALRTDSGATKDGRVSKAGAKRDGSTATTRASDGVKKASEPVVTIGIDLGDRKSHYCVLDAKGMVVEKGQVSTTPEALRRRFGGEERARIALEVGTHSPWVSQLLTELGHEVLVANARKLALIYENRRKGDAVDCESLARVARMDPKLLSCIQHRSATMARDLAVLRSRDVLVRSRAQLINHVRGAVKSTGERLKKGSSRNFAKNVVDEVPVALRQALSPVLATIHLLSEQIRDMNAHIEELGETKYPETKSLREVSGVGPLIALAFVLTLQSPRRFEKSRDVGPYLGMVPSRSQSGSSDPQLRITKEGDSYLRRLLVQAAQHILGPFAPDCDLRRFGLSLAARGGKNAKKRAIVAVARKLAVLLHRLWISGEAYEPLRRPNARLEYAIPGERRASRRAAAGAPDEELSVREGNARPEAGLVAPHVQADRLVKASAVSIRRERREATAA